MAFAEVLKTGDGAQFPTMRDMKAWAFARLHDCPFDTVITYAELETALSLSPERDRRARAAVLHAGRKMLTEHRKKLVNVKGVGYRVIAPTEHVDVSKKEQRRARRWLRESLATVTYVALDNMSPVEIAKVMTEQARAALQLALTKRLSRVKSLPPRQDLRLPSSATLVSMMRRKTQAE